MTTTMISDTVMLITSDEDKQLYFENEVVGKMMYVSSSFDIQRVSELTEEEAVTYKGPEFHPYIGEELIDDY